MYFINFSPAQMAKQYLSSSTLYFYCEKYITNYRILNRNIIFIFFIFPLVCQQLTYYLINHKYHKRIDKEGSNYHIAQYLACFDYYIDRLNLISIRIF